MNMTLFTGCLFFGFVSYGAVDTGTAKLLARGDKVVIQQFSAKRDVKLPEVKASLQLAMTVTPKKMRGVNQILHQLKTAHGRTLAVTGVSQATSSTGLINVTANLTVHLPINELADIAKLTETYTKSGQRLTVINTIPYFSDALRQRVENKLALVLYGKAAYFLKQLNHLTRPARYTIGAIDYRPIDVQTPRPLVMMANTASARNPSPVRMEKSLTLQAKVVYITTDQKNLQHTH